MNYRMIAYLSGCIILILAGFMLLPLLVAVIYAEQSGMSFLWTILAAAAAGFLLTLLKPKNKAMYAREGFVITALGWILISLIGAVPFTLSGQIPSYLDAVFEMASGFTTTGASIVPNVEELDNCMNFWRCLSHWLGGMGILVFMLALVSLGGGQSNYLLRAESPGPSVGKMVPNMRRSSIILYGIYVGMTAVLVILLLAGGMPLFDSLCHAFGTAGTGGFGIRAASIGYYDSYYLQGVIAVFMVLFGINFNFWFFLLMRKFSAAFGMSEVKAYLGIILFSTIAIALNIAGSFPRFLHALHHAFFSVSSIITTTGFATVDFDAWPQLSRIILVLLMIVGACAGSTGGGVKVSRFLILFKSGVAEFRKLLHPRSVKVLTMDGKALGQDMIRGVQNYMVIYFAVTVISVLLVSIDNFDFVTTFTAVEATLNNIGPGLSLVGPAGNYAMFSPLSKIVLTLDMLLGRLELFPMLILMMPGTWRRR